LRISPSNSEVLSVKKSSTYSDFNYQNDSSLIDNEADPNMDSFKHDDLKTIVVPVPEHLTGAVIGQGGRNISEVRKRTQAVIKISDRQPSESNPRGSERTITIVGKKNSAEAAFALLLEKIQLASAQMRENQQSRSNNGNNTVSTSTNNGNSNSTVTTTTVNSNNTSQSPNSQLRVVDSSASPRHLLLIQQQQHQLLRKDVQPTTTSTSSSSSSRSHTHSNHHHNQNNHHHHHNHNHHHQNSGGNSNSNHHHQRKSSSSSSQQQQTMNSVSDQLEKLKLNQQQLLLQQQQLNLSSFRPTVAPVQYVQQPTLQYPSFSSPQPLLFPMQQHNTNFTTLVTAPSLSSTNSSNQSA
jgi:hypothetical protein